MAKLKECDPDSPYRCQSTGSGGESQCRYYSIEGLVKERLTDDYDEHRGVKMCPKHGHNVWETRRKASLSNYKLERWQGKLREKADSPEAKNLRDEIGILRMTLEAVLNNCNNAEDFEVRSHQINTTVVNISKVIAQCDRLDDKQGSSLDRSKAIKFADQLALLISKHVDEDGREAIMDDVFNLLQDLLK